MPAICLNTDFNQLVTRPKKTIQLEFLKAHIETDALVIVAFDARGNQTTLSLKTLSSELVGADFTPIYDGKVSLVASDQNGTLIDDSMCFTVGPFPILTIESPKAWYEHNKPIPLKIRSNVNLVNREDVSFTCHNQNGEKVPFKVQNNILSFVPPEAGSYALDCYVDDSLVQGMYLFTLSANQNKIVIVPSASRREIPSSIRQHLLHSKECTFT